MPVPGSVEALLVEVSDALDADLDTLDAEAWGWPVVHGMTVQATIAHLAAVHHVALEAVLEPGRPLRALDLDEVTDRWMSQHAGETPEQTRVAWRTSVHRLRHILHGPPNELSWLGRAVVPSTLALDRAFETWVHANDIRRVTNRSSLDPSGEHFALLCGYVVDLLPGALATSSRTHDAVLTVALSGPGGGTFTVPLGSGCASGNEGALQASARELCLLVGDRIDPADFACTVRGSDAAVVAARDLVECASVFARR